MPAKRNNNKKKLSSRMKDSKRSSFLLLLVHSANPSVVFDGMCYVRTEANKNSRLKVHLDDIGLVGLSIETLET